MYTRRGLDLKCARLCACTRGGGRGSEISNVHVFEKYFLENFERIKKINLEVVSIRESCKLITFTRCLTILDEKINSKCKNNEIIFPKSPYVHVFVHVH